MPGLRRDVVYAKYYLRKGRNAGDVLRHDHLNGLTDRRKTWQWKVIDLDSFIQKYSQPRDLSETRKPSRHQGATSIESTHGIVTHPEYITQKHEGPNHGR